MKLKIGEMAALSGVTVRTLQHYDRIGLLRPEKDPENSYRLYDDGAVDRLQEILLLRALDIPLKEIGGILGATDYQRLEALKRHRELTLARIEELKTLHDTIEKSILEMEEGIVMSKEEKFEGMDFRQNPYEEEAREKWGDASVDESNAKMAEKNDAELQDLSETLNGLLGGFAALRSEDPASPQVQEHTRKYYELMSREMGSFYTLEVFKGLGEMYVADERFTSNLDQFGEGTARFMRDAIVHYVDSGHAADK